MQPLSNLAQIRHSPTSRPTSTLSEMANTSSTAVSPPTKPYQSAAILRTFTSMVTPGTLLLSLPRNSYIVPSTHGTPQTLGLKSPQSPFRSSSSSSLLSQDPLPSLLGLMIMRLSSTRSRLSPMGSSQSWPSILQPMEAPVGNSRRILLLRGVLRT